MSGYGARAVRGLGQFAQIVDGISLGLQAGTSAWNAYTQFQAMEHKEDELKQRRAELQAQIDAAEDAKEIAKNKAAAALAANQQSAGAGIAAAARGDGDVPAWAWALGAAVFATGLVVFLTGRKR